MQSMILPIVVCSEIDKIVQGFIWDSSSESRKISLVNCRTTCTPLWSALSSVWDSFHENVCWLVGDGADVCILDDTWVPSLGPLRQWLRIPNHVADNLQFNDILLHNSQWDADHPRELLHHDVVSHVIGILPPALDDSHDVQPLWEAVDSKWSHFWSLPVTDCIRLFLWLVLRERLMTNEERCHRGLTLEPLCLSCGCVRETILHVLRDWPPLGTYVISSLGVASFILSYGSYGSGGMSSFSMRLVFHWLMLTESLAHGWLCLNADASISPVDGVGTIGGVLRDSSKAWLQGYRKCVGKVSTTQAELWSI
ncbi:hypothetical protein V6N11_031542 [Hibiscus sabdariffa]|uniref:Reverse transcriptase zinc-binding domain-containing protein n=1 Tax=Hibiscus sabdariffa TaxID=183260 RepID=A0ABR2SYL7_9ROSI